MLSESWCNKRNFSVYSALYTCLLRMGRSSTRNIRVKGFSKYASKPDALKKVLLYMLGCVEMLAMIYKNCSLHAVIGERLKKVSKCFSCKIFTDVSVRISPIQKPRRRKIRQESRRQLQSPSWPIESVVQHFQILSLPRSSMKFFESLVNFFSSLVLIE